MQPNPLPEPVPERPLAAARIEPHLNDGILQFPNREYENTGISPQLFATYECITDTQRALFVAERDRLSQDLGAFLTPYSLEQYDRLDVQLFLAPCGRGGYGLLDGELISLFSLRGAGLGPTLVRDSIERGAWHLECLDARGVLGKFYGSFGFVEVDRIAWDDRYAPPHWNYERFGRPDLIKMELQGSR